jgi:hypothetical protein
MSTQSKRNYQRRTDEDRISELTAKVEKIKQRMEMKSRKDSPVLREVTKVQRVLRKFAQTALDHGREDLANSTQAFAAGLERSLSSTMDEPRRRGRSSQVA